MNAAKAMSSATVSPRDSKATVPLATASAARMATMTAKAASRDQAARIARLLTWTPRRLAGLPTGD
jgi:hypothetical protein